MKKLGLLMVLFFLCCAVQWTMIEKPACTVLAKTSHDTGEKKISKKKTTRKKTTTKKKTTKKKTTKEKITTKKKTTDTKTKTKDKKTKEDAHVAQDNGQKKDSAKEKKKRDDKTSDTYVPIAGKKIVRENKASSKAKKLDPLVKRQEIFWLREQHELTRLERQDTELQNVKYSLLCRGVTHFAPKRYGVGYNNSDGVARVKEYCRVYRSKNLKKINNLFVPVVNWNLDNFKYAALLVDISEADMISIDKLFYSDTEELSNKISAVKKRLHKEWEKYVVVKKQQDKIQADEIVRVVVDPCNISGVSGVTTRQLQLALAGTKLQSFGEYFVQAEKKYHVNAIVLASLVAVESKWGRQSAAVSSNNLTGLTSANSNINLNFKSPKDNIMKTAKFLSEEYIPATGKYFSGPGLDGLNQNYSKSLSFGSDIEKMAKVIINRVPLIKKKNATKKKDTKENVAKKTTTKKKATKKKATKKKKSKKKK